MRFSGLIKPALFTVGVGGVSIVGGIYLDREFKLRYRREIFGVPMQYAVFAPIVALNGAVFLAWKMRPNARLLWKYFLMHAQNVNSFSLLGCTFSHMGVFHFGFNMMALHSMINIIPMLGPCHFAGFYVASGVFTSFCSLAWKTLSRSNVGSLGASGSVISVLGLLAVGVPGAKFGLLFVPSDVLSVTGNQAILGLAAFSIVGLLSRGRFFSSLDHMGHLAACAAGPGYLAALRWYNQKSQPHHWRKYQ